MFGNKMNKTYKTATSDFIKLIAILCMTGDHIAWAVFPGFSHEPLAVLLHLLGRITCPVMCYFAAEGFYRTRSVKKYALRLLALAFVSHFAYIYASGRVTGLADFIPFRSGGFLNGTSVIFSLLAGLLMLCVAKSEKIKSTVLRAVLIAALCIISLCADWGFIAPLAVLCFGLFRGRFRLQAFSLAVLTALWAVFFIITADRFYGFLQFGMLLSLPLLALYGGRRSKNPKLSKFMKWAFYVYYPAHLFIIGLLK